MIIPILHRILVKQNKLEETHADYIRASKAGLIIPDHPDKQRAQAGVDIGTVVAIGPTAFKDYGVDCPIAVGQTIAFARFGGKVVKDPKDNQEYVLLNDEDVCTIVNGE